MLYLSEFQLSHTRPYLADARPWLIHCDAPSRIVTRINGKALFSLSLAENDDVDTLKVAYGQ